MQNRMSRSSDCKTNCIRQKRYDFRLFSAGNESAPFEEWIEASFVEIVYVFDIDKYDHVIPQSVGMLNNKRHSSADLAAEY